MLCVVVVVVVFGEEREREREREGGGERGQYLVVPIVVLYLLPGIRVYLAVVCSGWLL